MIQIWYKSVVCIVANRLKRVDRVGNFMHNILANKKWEIEKYTWKWPSTVCAYEDIFTKWVTKLPSANKPVFSLKLKHDDSPFNFL